MTPWRDLFDGELELVTSALDESLARLPARRGLALLTAEGDRPVLLLPAADLRARVAGRLKNPDEQERRRTPDLLAVTRKILWRLAPSHFECDLRFLEISRTLWPDSYADLLAWKPPWFIRVDLSADYPYFSRTQEKWGRYPISRGNGAASPLCSHGNRVASLFSFGPFPSGLAAQRYLDALADAFRLCRDVRCLRQAPNGRRCSYGQMGKCLCACDGTTSSDDYRAAVARAAEFVAGDRAAVIDQLQQEMKRAAGELQFERASLLKGRLARLAELEAEDYAFVAPRKEFRFLLVQRGEGRRTLSVFLANAAGIRPAGTINYPVKKEQIAELAGRALAVDAPVGKRPQGPPGEGVRPGPPLSAPCSSCAPPDPWAMGLVAHYLFAAPRRRGLILSLRAGLAPDVLEKEIDAFVKSLAIRKDSKPSPSGELDREPPRGPMDGATG